MAGAGSGAHACMIGGHETAHGKFASLTPTGRPLDLAVTGAEKALDSGVDLVDGFHPIPNPPMSTEYRVMGAGCGKRATADILRL